MICKDNVFGIEILDFFMFQMKLSLDHIPIGSLLMVPRA